MYEVKSKEIQARCVQQKHTEACGGRSGRLGFALCALPFFAVEADAGRGFRLVGARGFFLLERSYPLLVPTFNHKSVYAHGMLCELWLAPMDGWVVTTIGAQLISATCHNM